MELFIARHGETTWNVENKVCGRTDVPLTQQGREQAQRLAQEARKYDLDLILSSPLKRALDTAKAVGDACGIPILVDHRLIEQDYGIYEGADRQDAAFLANKRNFAYKYPSGESMMLTAQRVYNLLDEIGVKFQGKRVLLVCHGGICRIAHTYFADVSNEEFFRFNTENAALARYCYPKENVEVN